MKLDKFVHELCTEGKNFAALSTLMPEGSPQVSIVWVDASWAATGGAAVVRSCARTWVIMTSSWFERLGQRRHPARTAAIARTRGGSGEFLASVRLTLDGTLTEVLRVYICYY